MSYKIDMNELGELVSLNNKKKLASLSFDKKLCAGVIDRTMINENIFLLKSDLHFLKDISISSEYYEDVLSITIPLCDASYQYTNSSDLYINEVKKNFTNIFLSKYCKGVGTLKKDSFLQSIQIIIKKDFLLNNFEGQHLEKIEDIFNTTNECKTISNNISNIKSKLCALELFNNTQNDPGSLYTQSKVFEILSYELNSIFELNSKINNKIKFSEYDLLALHKAKEILIQNYQNPPSLTELSKLVKLNEFKIKFGFKKLFGKTPYNIVLDCKMYKAKELLERSELNVHEIAQSLGYKQSCNFTKAFINKYHLRPKDIMKSRQYYY